MLFILFLFPSCISIMASCQSRIRIMAHGLLCLTLVMVLSARPTKIVTSLPTDGQIDGKWKMERWIEWRTYGHGLAYRLKTKARVLSIKSVEYFRLSGLCWVLFDPKNFLLPFLFKMFTLLAETRFRTIIQKNSVSKHARIKWKETDLKKLVLTDEKNWKVFFF